jgi:hypothetical protein
MEVRGRPFVSIKEEGLLDEKIFEFFTIKHLIYVSIALAIIYFSSANVVSLTFGIIVAFFVTVCAVYPTKALKFEAVLAGVIYYLLFKRNKYERRVFTVPDSVKSARESIENVLDVGTIDKKDVEALFDEGGKLWGF